MDYEQAYNLIMQLQAELAAKLYMERDTPPDYKTIQALAATFTLQDYTAARIAEQGEPPEGAELDE